MGAAENKKVMQEVFAAWARGEGGAFFNVLADDVRWTVIGSCPVSRTYTSRQAFLDGAVKPLSEKLAGPIHPTVRNILAEGDMVVVQWDGTATTKAGKPYNNRYCWVMRMENGKVTEGTAYIDTELVSELWRS
ncbi:MAG: nuclear transport factor 2 family protein [Candidatus Binatia bacterium]|nr:nuclear transport factor 2 family protein [Candidatus Binatia bacterium]